MPSEYHKWLARNEKPEEKRELTEKEKRANWWYYHKTHVIVGALVVLLTVWFVYDTWIDVPVKPDLQIAYVGGQILPQDTVDVLQTALGAMMEDLNGDGQVLVRINQYQLSMESEDYMLLMAEQARLAADISECESFMYLMEDPSYVQKGYGPLAYPDGTAPGEEDLASEKLWMACKDCPVLMGLLEEKDQKLLSELFIARRVVRDDQKDACLEGNVALWEQLIQRAE